MASNYSPTTWTNGSGQPLSEGNMNKLEGGVEDASDGANIKIWYEGEANTNAYTDAEKADVADAVVDLVDHEARLVHLEDTGMSVMSGSNLTPQTIGITATKVISFDTLAIEVGVGTTGDIPNNKAIADSNGVFKLRYESFISYASNVDIIWQIWKNGAPFGASIELAGDGARIFPILLISSTSLLANDELELYATASASTDITIAQSNGTLEKTHF